MAITKIIADSITSGAVGITQADIWRVNSDISSTSTATVIASNLERADDATSGLIGSGMSHSSGIFTFPQTGIYEVTFLASYFKEGDTRYVVSQIEATADNSNYDTVAYVLHHIEQSYSIAHASVISHALVDVTNTSNVKVRFLHRTEASATLNSESDKNNTYMKFIRLGDT